MPVFDRAVELKKRFRAFLKNITTKQWILNGSLFVSLSIFIIYVVLMRVYYYEKPFFLNPYHFEYKRPSYLSTGKPHTSSKGPGGEALISTLNMTPPIAYYVKAPDETYYYPLYLNQTIARRNSTDGIANTHTFITYPDITFYMPNSKQFIKQTNPPTSDEYTLYPF